MSEIDKNQVHCENCGAELRGKFCHLCGQKHIEHKHSFLQLMIHFLGDFVHFDAQLFTTLKPLFIKPGLVPRDYVNGRRKRHLEPIKMYVFVSIVFFFLFINFSNVKTLNQPDVLSSKSISKNELAPDDSSRMVALFEKLESTIPDYDWSELDKDIVSKDIKSIKELIDLLEDKELDQSIIDEVNETTKLYDYIPTESSSDGANSVNINITSYKSLEDYQSHQDTLSKHEKDGWIKRELTKKAIAFEEKARDQGQSIFMVLLYNFLKNLPKLLFIMLPIYGLVMKLLYVRRDVYYVDHMIFMIYFFSFLYIILTINLLFDIAIGIWLPGIFTLWAIIYYLLAMKRFYGQSWPKTVLKYILFGNISFFLTLMAAILGFIVIALFGS